MKQNIKKYSENELSLQVYNTESLYLDRFSSDFIDILNEIFEYTQEQLEVLNNDINEELEEI